MSQPSEATVNIVCYAEFGGPLETILLSLSPPAPGATEWNTQWDTRGIAPGLVLWSVQSEGPLPTVEDGYFRLTANSANLPTF